MSLAPVVFRPVTLRGWIALVVACPLLGLAACAASAAEPASTADYDTIITDTDREHWAFQPVRRPPVPDVRHRGWARHPIDQFIQAPLEAKGWQPGPSAPLPALVRRMFLDLTGLPPTPEELAVFTAGDSPEQLDRLLEVLLARPSYGERWARHWLDLVRYAESNGYERDGAKPSVWRYRDYVIRSFNADKPYDRFLLEQLAGDELPDVNAETLTALGYYRLGPWDDEPADPLEDRFDQLDDMVSTTGQVFLGLTLGCARCHNHKFEPLTQLDYYRVAAVVNPLQRFQNGRSDLDAPIGTPAELAALAARDRQIAELQEQIKADGGDSEEAKSRNAARRERIAALQRETPDLPRGYYLHEPPAAPPQTHVLLRGKPGRPGIVAPPGVPTVLVSQQPEFVPGSGPTSGRRLAFARWLADPRNPLTARVIVNRVWQFHFGEGLVRTSSDFGIMGDPPSHPALLDYLAAEFVTHGWSLKWLHRQILSSSTYRMSKQWNAEYGAKDPENRLWWRFPYRRLEVEALRDSMLLVTGRLNGQMFGPAMYPFIPAEALAGNSDPDKIWPAYDEVAASRRTVYAFVKRSLVVPLLEVLDLCDTTKSAARRPVTSVAPQALTLFNGRFVNEQAEWLAKRLERDAGAEADARIERGWRLALARPPRDAERVAMREFLETEAARLSSEAAQRGETPTPEAIRHQALVQLCRVIFNLNEFAYPD